MNSKEIALFAWLPFLARSRRRIGSMTLLLPLPEQRKVTVKSGKIISDRVIEANREVVAEL
jgi:hypothetical protein